MSFEGTVENGVIVLDASQPLPNGTRVEVTVREVPIANTTREPKTANEKSRSSLADWAEQNAEHWGRQLSSEDVEGFTGRRN